MTPKRTLLSVLLLVLLVLWGAFLLRQGERRANGIGAVDFVQYYFQSWQLHTSGRIYDPITVSGELASHTGWEYDGAGLRPTNPPAFALLTYPLAALPYHVAWWSLCALSVAILLIAPALVARELQLPMSIGLVAGAISLLSFPAIVFLVLNHIEAPVVLLSVLGWIALRRGRGELGGMLWGLAAALKLFPALWLVPLLIGQHRRYGVIGFATFIVVSLLAAAIVGFEHTQVFLTEVLPQSKLWNESVLNLSIVSTSNAVFDSTAIGWSLHVLVALVIVILLLNAADIDRSWLIAVCGSIILSPLGWSYYLVLVPPCLMLLAHHLDLAQRGDKFLLLFFVWTLLFWPTLAGGALAITSPEVGSTHMLVPTLSLLALCIVAHLRVDNS